MSGQKRSKAKIAGDSHEVLYAAARDAFTRAAQRRDDGVLLFEPSELDLERAIDAYKERAAGSLAKGRVLDLQLCQQLLLDHDEF